MTKFTSLYLHTELSSLSSDKALIVLCADIDCGPV